jgi:hypothetical protein
MKGLITFLIVFASVFPPVSQPAGSENYGQIRALKHRAHTVVQRKNDFVARVLQSYDIRFQRSRQGVVNRLQIGGQWQNVSQIEIVPLVVEGSGGPRLVAHEIYFYTEEEILHLVSSITIR